jgi:hypothetical protein
LVHIKDPKTSDPSPAIAMLPISSNEALVMGPLNRLGETVHYRIVDGQPRIEFSGYVLVRRP